MIPPSLSRDFVINDFVFRLYRYFRNAESPVRAFPTQEGRARFQNRPGSTGYQPVLAGNLPDSIWTLEKPVGRLPTGTGKLPVLPVLKNRPNDAVNKT